MSVRTTAAATAAETTIDLDRTAWAPVPPAQQAQSGQAPSSQAPFVEEETMAGDRAAWALITPVAAGAAVALLLGVYGRLHAPTSVAVNLAGFSGPQEVKVWLATGAMLGALIQLGTALVMYGRIRRIAAPAWLPSLHRWSGRGAFLLSVPVAMHCLYALGFGSYDLRVLVHSLAGCMFYGAFTVKMLSLTRRGMPGWALPLLGGGVFTGLALLWLSSSLWFFTTVGVRL